MTKEEFLAQLQNRLAGLPREDLEERLTFYSEMIDDRLEEGLTEEEAIAEIGSVQEVAAQILADTPLTKLMIERVKPKRSLKVWEILLLVLGAPLWIPLLITAIAVLFTVYAVIWTVALVLWSVMVAVFFVGLGGMIAAAVIALRDSILTGLSLFFAGLCLLGLSIFMFFGCKAATQGLLLLTKKIASGIKALFVGKEIVS